MEWLAHSPLEGGGGVSLIPSCDAPNPEGPLTTCQPAEKTYLSHIMRPIHE